MTASILFWVGLLDLIFTLTARIDLKFRWIASGLVALLAMIISTALQPQTILTTGLGIMVVVAWLVIDQHFPRWRPHASIGLIVIVVAGFALDLVWQLPVAWPLWLSVTLFLVGPGNKIVRSFLQLAGRAEQQHQELHNSTNTLRGGRMIGPLERIMLVGLVLAQAYPVVAALMAAKGIVRFPEISADRQHGAKAEEFLIGSLVSWGLAGGGAYILHVLA